MASEPAQPIVQEAVASEVEKTRTPGAATLISLTEIPAQEAAEVRRLLRRIRRKNPVRQAAEAFLDSGTIMPRTPQLLLQNLKTPRPYFWRRQAVAAWMLGHKPWHTEDYDSAEAAEKRLIKMLDVWPMHNTGFRLLRSLAWGGSVCVLFFGMTLLQSRSLGAFLFVIILLFGGVFMTAFFAVLFLPFLALAEHGKITRVRMAAIAALGRLRSVEGLPALTRACISGPENDSFSVVIHSRKMRRMALQSMERVLPCITEYDYARLASNMPNLCKALESLAIKPRHEIPLSEAVALHILAALGKVGDGRAVVSVERVRQKATTEALRVAAMGVLPLLQDRQRQENAANTLLRGASPNTAAQETLLRATTPAEHTDPDQLLRSSVPVVSKATMEPQLLETQVLQPPTSATETAVEVTRMYEMPAPETLVQQTSQ